MKNILENNVYSKVFKDKFLVVGVCVEDLYPEIFEKFKKEWKNVVYFCLENNHYNQLVAKLFDILSIGNTQKVGFLTVDGSPHCVQMHFASKYLKRGLKNNVEFEHYVINKNGNVFKIDLDTIDDSKNLSRGKNVIDND